MDQISLHPLVLLDEQFLSSDECAAIAALARNDARLSEADIPVKMDETGRSAELPLGLDPLLTTVAERFAERLGLTNHVGHTLRMRHFGVGQGHPPHVDSYTIDGHELIATGIVCVCAPELGGETVFPDAEGGVLAGVQAEGQLVAWHNLHPDGTPNPAARHLATPVESGEKIILSWFIYGTPVALLDAPTGEPRVYESSSSLPGLGRMLAIVDDGVPAETVALMRASAEGLGVRVCIVDPDRFDFDPERQLRPGDLMYRPAVSMHAMRTEQHLWRPDIGSFYEDPEGPLFSNVNALETFRRAGLSVPRTRWISRMDRDLLRTFVDALGGFPLVLKMPGYSSGVGGCASTPIPPSSAWLNTCSPKVGVHSSAVL